VGLELPCHANTIVLFAITTMMRVGNGSTTLFWTDRWLHGCSIADLAPSVFYSVLQRDKNSQTVAQALEEDAWIGDIQGGLSMRGIAEFLNLVDCLA
jgi:hypothetical protein